jgi:hypothetical protein
VLAFSWISSLGTGLVANGIYFLTRAGYAFGDAENYALALAGGATYIAGALGAGPLLKFASERAGLSTRAVVGVILVAMAALCALPLAVAQRGGQTGHWPMWVMVCLYQPLTGVLWPVVERYLSGGRSGVGLRSALGRWNVTWSAALVVGLCLMGRFQSWPREALLGLGLMHLFSIPLLVPLGREPGEHLEDQHEPHPPVYGQLLAVFRILLPASYIVLTTLSPYLPTITSDLDVPLAWQPAVAATWTMGRVVTFFLLERWHGWQGRWWPAAAAVLALLGGFAAAMLSREIGPGLPGQIVLVAGLLAFGVGMSTIYTASLYYAMECERESVDAGSRHEALIGVGYTVGPACGLAAIGIAQQAAMGPRGPDFIKVGLVLAIALTLTGTAVARSARAARAGV